MSNNSHRKMNQAEANVVINMGNLMNFPNGLVNGPPGGGSGVGGHMISEQSSQKGNHSRMS